MATIGTFKKTGTDNTGEIVTLSVQVTGVRIVPVETRTSENAPSHRVFVGRAEIGAAWSKTSNEGRAYLGLKLDDPSCTNRSTPTSSTTRTARATASSGPVPAARTATDADAAPPGSPGGAPSAGAILP